MNPRFGFLSLALAGLICLPVLADDEKKSTTDKETTKASKTDEGSKPKKDTSSEDKEVKDKEEKFTATCPVSGSSAKKDQTVAYKDKEVYFCCEKCKAAYEAEPAKFATKANFQLVQTKQFKQTACPLSGGKTNKEQSARIEGVKVAFCCDKCKGAVESASEDEQLAKVFAEEIFTKAFAAKKDKPESSEGNDAKPADAPPKKGKGKNKPDGDKPESSEADKA
jgi:YHS domain-containing protein